MAPQKYELNDRTDMRRKNCDMRMAMVLGKTK
jgi:hypothetical protein